MTPLLLNHDHSRDAIGQVVASGDALIVRLDCAHRMTKEQLFAIFGSAGIVITRQHFENGVGLIEEFEIICWSVPA